MKIPRPEPCTRGSGAGPTAPAGSGGPARIALLQRGDSAPGLQLRPDRADRRAVTTGGAPGRSSGTVAGRVDRGRPDEPRSAARPALIPSALAGLGAATAAGATTRWCRGRVRAVETGPARGTESAGDRGRARRRAGGGRGRGRHDGSSGAGDGAAHDAGVRHQRRTGGADFHQGPHLGNGRIMAQYQQHTAHAVHLTVLVGGALRLPTGAGGVRVHGGRAGMRPDVGLGETAQRGEVTGPRRHGTGRGARDRRGAVAVAGDADGPRASRTSRGRGFGVWEVQDRQSFGSGMFAQVRIVSLPARAGPSSTGGPRASSNLRAMACAGPDCCRAGLRSSHSGASDKFDPPGSLRISPP